MTQHAASLVLDGSPLDFKTLAQIGAQRVLVVAGEDGMRRCEAGRPVFDRMIAAGLPVYGSTTGVGALKDRILSPEELDDFNAGLVRAHHFGKWIAGGGAVKLAASSEFVNSAAAMPAFQTAYGFSLKPDQLLTLSGGDTAATIAAAAQGTNDVNSAMVYGTDGGIAPSGLVVMADDKGVQPVYQPSPIVREEVLKANPRIEEVLKPIFAGLDLVTLQELNGRVQVGGEPANAVAEDYLKTKGFLK